MNENTPIPTKEKLADISTLELTQILAERLAIPHQDWHRLKGNRKAQAGQQITSALIYLLKNKPELALTHLDLAKGWLDKTLKTPPCPSHGNKIK